MSNGTSGPRITASAEKKFFRRTYCQMEGCGNLKSEHFLDGICDSHGFAIYRDALRILDYITPRYRRKSQDEIDRKQRFRELEIEREQVRQKVLDEWALVYYVRLGEYVKIGTTSHLASRIVDLRTGQPDWEILATEPGGRALESKRHKQFAATRRGRSELFTPSPELMEHIKAVREINGEPVMRTSLEMQIEVQRRIVEVDAAIAAVA